MSNQIDEGADYGSLNTLEYVLRGRDLKGTLRWLSRATPWWIVSVAFHLAAALVLVRVISMAGIAERADDIIIVSCPYDQPQPIDLKEIMPIFQPTSSAQYDPVITSPVLVHDTSVEVAEPGVEEVEPPLDPGPPVEDPGADPFALDPLCSQECGPPPCISPGSLFTSRHSNVGAVVDHLVPRMIGPRRRGSGDVLLIWLIDASVSMRDDQRAVRDQLWRMDRQFRQEKGSGELKQSVVYFSDRAHLWLAPTTDVEQVMEAIRHLEVSSPGTKENTMGALLHVTKTFRNQPTLPKRKVVVLLDDDSPDDSELTELALRELKRARMTLFVINRECPFQSQQLLESYEWQDEDGITFSGRGLVRRGPESARPEVTNIGFGSFSSSHWGGGLSAGGRVLSGFGIYDISRLAAYTGGTYYVLTPTDESLYDWDLMDSYRPELVSRAEYDKRTARNPYKRVLQLVTAHWNRGLPHLGRRDLPGAKRALERARDKLDEADRLILRMEREALMPDDRLAQLKENCRWPANADLVWASLILARHRLRQYSYALEAFLKKTPSLPDGHVVSVAGHGKVVGTLAEKRDREAVIRALRYVANRHPRTPWGYVASMIFEPQSNRCLYGFTFSHHKYFHPYWAVFVLRNGKKYTGYVTAEDRERGTITLTVPRHGTATRSRSFFRDIRRILPPPGAKHNGIERI